MSEDGKPERPFDSKDITNYSTQEEARDHLSKHDQDLEHNVSKLHPKIQKAVLELTRQENEARLHDLFEEDIQQNYQAAIDRLTEEEKQRAASNSTPDTLKSVKKRFKLPWMKDED